MARRPRIPPNLPRTITELRRLSGVFRKENLCITLRHVPNNKSGTLQVRDRCHTPRFVQHVRVTKSFTYDAAMTSISTNASFGSRATCTVERAGGAWLKNLPYTSFIAAKSLMSFKKTVVFTT